jgi:hypothetical protein
MVATLNQTRRAIRHAGAVLVERQGPSVDQQAVTDGPADFWRFWSPTENAGQRPFAARRRRLG